MGCDVLKDSTGLTLIICGSRSQRARCKYCGRPATKLCDFPLHGSKKGKTCDANLCDRCAVKIGPDRDFCPPHSRQLEMAL